MPEHNHDSTILIVGNGQAAAMAMQALRNQGYPGAIVVVGDEAHLAYERPPLSKDLLSDANAQAAGLGIHPREFYDGARITLLLGKTVTRIDPQRHAATLDTGETISYDQCLLACGGQARVLGDYPPGHPRIHYLRTADDALRLRAALTNGARIAVLGGGFLGMELASTALSLGTRVDLIESAPRILARNAPALFSEWLQARARHLGLNLHLDARVAASTGLAADDTAPIALTLDNGRQVQADHLLVSIGMTPNADLASACGIEVCQQTGGILVDSKGRTGITDIFAAGDCTTRRDAITGMPVRLESWQNANEQARIAACAMLGVDCAPAAFPWFWTDQFGCNIQMLGTLQPDMQFTVRGDMDAQAGEPDFLMLGLSQAVPRFALAVNAGGELRALRGLLEKAIPIDADAFVQAESPKSFAKKAMAAHTSQYAAAP